MLQNLVRQYYDYLVSYLGDYALKVFNADNALKQLSNSLAEELLRRRGRTR
jgi:hypothetical protein